MISQGFLNRVAENIKSKQKAPYCIDWIVNDFCNLRCLYCSPKLAHNSKSIWSKEKLIKILESAKKLNVQEISITSIKGEPAIFKDIRFLMEEIKKRSFMGTLLTNGTRLDLEAAYFIQKIKWDILILSLDSFRPEIQYQLRPSFGGDETYLENIIKFLEYSAKNNPVTHINLNMVVNSLNYHDLIDYFKKAESYGVKNITLLKLMKQSEHYEELALTEKQLMEFNALLKNIKSPVNFNHLEWIGDIDEQRGTPVDKIKDTRKNCYFHFYKVLIGCNGQILKCNGDPQATEFNVEKDDLETVYPNLLEAYKDFITNPSCWDTCCSPIKTLNQEIAYYLERDALRKLQ